MTCGVIQPAQTLSRGNWLLSRISTSRPARRSCCAHDEPAGPPPTINTSQDSRVLIARSSLVDVGPRPRNLVVAARGEHHLEQLQLADRKRRLRAEQIQPPHTHEALVEHLRDAI